MHVRACCASCCRQGLGLPDAHQRGQHDGAHNCQGHGAVALVQQPVCRGAEKLLWMYAVQGDTGAWHTGRAGIRGTPAGAVLVA